MSGWYFEGSNFVVMDLRAVIAGYNNENYPYGWRGTAGGKVDEVDPAFAVLHQTYGSIRDGEKGPVSTAAFCTRNPKFKCNNPKCGHKWEGSAKYPSTRCPKCNTNGRNLAVGRGFPNMPYHVFMNYRPKRNEKGKWIVYYCVDFGVRTWQASGGNAGFAVAMQGRMRSRHNPQFRPTPGTDGEPSAAQQAILLPLWREFIVPQFGWGPEQLKGHFLFGKKACPGDHGESFVLSVRAGEAPVPFDAIDPAPSEMFDTWQERQAALVAMGYDLGPYGPRKNGVDNDPGNLTRLAIEAFQADAGIDDHGEWDVATEEAMLDAFADNEMTYGHVQEQITGEAPLPAEKPAVKAEPVPAVTEVAPPQEEDVGAAETQPKPRRRKKRKAPTS